MLSEVHGGGSTKCKVERHSNDVTHTGCSARSGFSYKHLHYKHLHLQSALQSNLPTTQLRIIYIPTTEINPAAVYVQLTTPVYFNTLQKIH